VRGPMLLKEYYKRPDATAESIDGEGFFHTGDAGYFDGDGHLKIIDRAKDVGKLRNGGIFAPNYIENKLKFFPHIKEAVAFGDGRDMVCAFVNIDIGSVGNWAERRGLAYSGYTDLAAKPEVYELIRECVGQVNAEFAADPAVADSQIHRFLVLHKELDPDDDELTRTRKVRRGFVAEKYAVLIDALYSGKAVQHIATQVKFEDGRTGMVAADLVIAEAKTFPAAAGRKPHERAARSAGRTRAAGAAQARRARRRTRTSAPTLIRVRPAIPLASGGRRVRPARERAHGRRAAFASGAAARGGRMSAESERRIGDVILLLENISLAFGGVKAISDVSFDVREHEIRAIIGPNGAARARC